MADDGRLVVLEGTMNFRDIGGYAAGEGRVVRRGQVFRADALSRLTTADHDVLAGLGLKVAYDLRRSREVEAAPDLLPDSVERVWLPMADDDPAEPREIIELVLSGELAEVKAEFMADIYASMLDDHSDVFGTLFEGLSDGSRRPAVFHCTAGKDRTGMAAALLLDLVGVDEETILDDYALTNRYRSQRRVAELRPQLESAGVDVDMVLPLLTAPREVMEFALAHLSDEYGSAERYLVGAAGVERGVIERLRAGLLTT